MFNIGFSEFAILCLVAGIYAIPIIIAVWAIATLKRIGSGQEIVQTKLEVIERLITQGRTAANPE